jgi:ribosomal protein L17
MNKFIAKNNQYGEPKEEIERLPESIKKKNIVDSYINDDDVLDLPSMTIQELSNQLQFSIGKGSPMFLWSKRRENEKQLLDNEKQTLILNKIQNLRAISDEFNRLKADIIFSQEFMKNLIANKRMEAEQFFETAVATHSLNLTRIKTEINLNNSLVNHDQIELDRKKAENERIRAENLITYAQADKLKAEAESIRYKNELYGLVIGKINFDNFPPVHLTYLLSVLSGFNTEAFTDLDIKEKLKDVFINMEETKAKKAQAEVDDFVNSAEFRKWKNDQAKKDAQL